MDGDTGGFKKLSADADAFRKLIGATVRESEKLKSSMINFAALATEHTVYHSSKREKELETENKTLRDSVSALNTRLESIKTDSVPTIVTVERKLSLWEQTKMDFGGMAIVVLVVGFLAVGATVAFRIWMIRKRN